MSKTGDMIRNRSVASEEAIFFHAFLRSRRSIRRFLPEEVAQEVLARVMETATWAPSAHNRQPWRFEVLITPGAKVRLADRMGTEYSQALRADGTTEEVASGLVERSRQRILEAPVVVVLCLDPTVGDRYPDDERRQAEHLMGVQSVALAGGTLLLAAHAEGLGGVWVCAPLFAPGAVRQALDIPLDWEPQGMLLLGYPAVTPAPRPRQPVEAVVRYL